MVVAVTTLPTAAGSVGDFAPTAASRPGGADAASQASAFRVGTVVTMATSGGPDTEACLTSKDWDYCCRDFAAELASRDFCFTDAAGSHTSGLCFSCCKAGHGATRCPALNEAFPSVLPGWKAEKVGCGYAMISPRVAAERQ